MLETLKIGTRGSPLALAQANMVKDQLLAAYSHLKEVEICVITTKGDLIQDKPLAEIGGKGLFTREIEDGLLGGSIDLAVHSSKDMPTTLPEGLSLPVFLKREDPRDALISSQAKTLADLAEGATVGTSSLRRAAHLLRARPDLKVVPFRGNVGTRMEKLENGEVAATFLAVAGLNRLGVDASHYSPLSTVEMLPAPAQGAVGIEVREDRQEVLKLVEALNDRNTKACVLAERAFLAELDGNCRTPIAALATQSKGELSLVGRVFSLDGSKKFEVMVSGPSSEPETLGKKAGYELIRLAGKPFLEDLARAVKEGQ